MARVHSRAVPTSAIPTRFAAEELRRLERARSRLGLPSRSALIRTVVMEKLEEVESMKIIDVRDMTVGGAERLIDTYLKGHPGRQFVSDIAEELGIELKVAFQAAERLIDRGGARMGRE